MLLGLIVVLVRSLHLMMRQKISKVQLYWSPQQIAIPSQRQFKGGSMINKDFVMQFVSLNDISFCQLHAQWELIAISIALRNVFAYKNRYKSHHAMSWSHCLKANHKRNWCINKKSLFINRSCTASLRCFFNAFVQLWWIVPGSVVSKWTN